MPVCKVTNKRIEALAADYTDRSDACRMSEGRWMMDDVRWKMDEGRGKREEGRWKMEDVRCYRFQDKVIEDKCL